tara:strand:+ start:3312 stop:3497 length:186 start_codon:yes stop_codon:yes gene_type:complete
MKVIITVLVSLAAAAVACCIFSGHVQAGSAPSEAQLQPHLIGAMGISLMAVSLMARRRKRK